MPLVRVKVRNEYGLGMPELYKEANREDPKLLLDGVAVAGFVGILRQLGDLAEFAAEVFHGLQEQVMNLSSRSHKLIVRVRNIEVELPPIENAMLAQRSHVHFAYTKGSNWHAHLQSEQNHFIYGDLPSLIMDLYGECCNPPLLHLLDKFETGGTGSCLKRYSDPTFFRRASAGFLKAYVENVRRDKKARRRKKKLWLKNGEVPYAVSHNIPTSSCSARMQYPVFSGQISPSRKVSTSDDRLKSGHGEQSYSFDSGAGSGYIECIFSPGYIIKSEEHTSIKDSFQYKLRHSDNLDAYTLNRQRELGNNDIQEQTGPRSSCVSWDEKTEIRGPVGSRNRCIETAKTIASDIDPDPIDAEAVNFRTLVDIKRTAAAVSCEVQLDDIGSETDAHNTVELDSESELQCQTKREVEQLSTLNSTAAYEGIGRLIPQEPYRHSQNFELHVPHSMHDTDQFSALTNEVVDVGELSLKPQYHQYSMSSSSNIKPHVVQIPSDKALIKSHSLVSPESPKVAESFSNKKASVAKPILLQSEIDAHVQYPQEGAKSSTLNTFAGIKSGESDATLDALEPGTYLQKGSSCDSIEPILPNSNIILRSSGDSQKPAALSSSVTGINFWTNGGLLGLEPSKPSDFSVSTSRTCDSVAKSEVEKVLHSSRSNVADGDRTAVETNIAKKTRMSELDRNSECTKSYNDDNKEDSFSIMNTSCSSSEAHFHVTHEHSNDFQHSHGQKQAHEQYLFERNTKMPEIEELVHPVGQATKYLNPDSKTQMLESSTELRGNGFHKRISYVGDESFISSMRNAVSEQKCISQEHQAFAGKSFKEQFESGSLFMSPSSSPPLEHMKIFFQPIEGLETSRLKLKFPDGSEVRESTGDKFHLFQLVPDQFISLQECGSNSDDDTFCRSSPHISDDCFSHDSQSDSERWEAKESTNYINPEIHDDLCEISTTGYVSSNVQMGRTDNEVLVDNHEHRNSFTGTCSELIQADHNLDLPSYDVLNPLFGKESHNTSNAKFLELDSSNKRTPPSPPLPPVQWRAMKLNPAVAMENPDTSFESLAPKIDAILLNYLKSQQPKPAPLRHDQDTEAIICATKNKQPDCQKLNGQKDANQSTDRKEIDGNAAFLQQIKTKSFSLKRTIVDRPTLPAASANVKVGAILEKANAIRQAIGNDDGEEHDSWSDT